MKIDGYREEVRTLRVWSVHLDMLGKHLFRKADECLKQLSTKVTITQVMLLFIFHIEIILS